MTKKNDVNALKTLLKQPNDITLISEKTKLGDGDFMVEELKCPKCGATLKTKEEMMKHNQEKHPM